MAFMSLPKITIKREATVVGINADIVLMAIQKNKMEWNSEFLVCGFFVFIKLSLLYFCISRWFSFKSLHNSILNVTLRPPFKDLTLIKFAQNSSIPFQKNYITHTYAKLTLSICVHNSSISFSKPCITQNLCITYWLPIRRLT